MARARLDGLALQGWHAHGAERAEIPGTAKIGEAKGPETGGEEGREETGEEERRRRTWSPSRRSPASSAALRPPGPSRFGLRPKRKRREEKRREETDLVANRQVSRLKCSASPSGSIPLRAAPEAKEERGEEERGDGPGRQHAGLPPQVQRFALRFNPSIRSILSMAPLVERSERLAREVPRLASLRLRATLCFAFEPREGDRSGPIGIDRTGTDRRGAPWSIHAT
jgi:hypothetical protein